MPRKRFRDFYTKEALGFFNYVVEDKPLLPFLIPLVFVAWAIERWLVPFSNWIPLAVAVWATIQMMIPGAMEIVLLFVELGLLVARTIFQLSYLICL